MTISKSKLLATLLVIAATAPVLAHGMSAEQKLQILQGGLPTFLWLGSEHMLTGYDHLLFLLGIVFYLDNFRDVVKYITLFTLGHSLTLTLGTYFQVSANEFAVDAVIALSVCYKAFDNLDLFTSYLKIRRPNLEVVIFGFGLIHGFGLATRLQELPLGRHDLIEKILTFNVGIELGQVVALVMILGLLRRWKRSENFVHWSKIANHAMLAVGLLLFLAQMHDYLHSAHPEHYTPTPAGQQLPLGVPGSISEPHHDSL